MASSNMNEVHDLLILVDATSSMHHYLASLRQSLPQILSISGLTNCFERVGVLAYRDYCDRALLEWSGWRVHQDSTKPQPNLVTIAGKLQAIGGGDIPEAVKTGLAKAHQVMREEAKTLILLYADAIPHMHGAPSNGYDNAEKEVTNLWNPSKYGGQGSNFIDWVSAAKTFRHGKKKAQVMAILQDSCIDQGVYQYLTAMTGGACISLKNSGRDSRQISELTVEVLLTWMGVHKPGSASTSFNAQLVEYQNSDGIDSVENEKDVNAGRFFIVNNKRQFPNYVRFDVSTNLLQQSLPKKGTPLQDFGEMYKQNLAYREIVVRHLKEIINRDVSTMSLNPVFGSLWRVYCNDRMHPDRQAILELFGQKINEIHDAEKREHMKHWLEESYDYTAEVQQLVESVPEAQRFPFVCLDPTLTFKAAADLIDDNDVPITEFKRDQLLEIGRSCNPHILRPLGRILTRLTLVSSAEEMPAHIAKASETEVPRIPIALAAPEYKGEFWKILLHLVVPGTMLSTRPAALLAALSLKLGILHLKDAAVQKLKGRRGTWNDIQVTENWNSSCLQLLLDADAIHQKDLDSAEYLGDDKLSLLSPAERNLFKTLVDYKLLEANLKTDLVAEVGWTPNRASLPVGPLVRCRSCKFPRSVTVMGPKTVCGLCLSSYDDKNVEREFKAANVTDSDTESTEVHWYECAIATCRVHYVVYNSHKLNVRPKCHYCREGRHKSPFVECGQCLSRMVWPLEYRDQNKANWTCIPCLEGRATTAHVDTTANALRDENGDDWLVRNEDRKVAQPFSGRSMFNVVSAAAPLHDFVQRVQILPGRTQPDAHKLYIRGKLVRNSQALFDDLYSWVSRRQAEQGLCSLCLEDLPKSALTPACGRKNCDQRICTPCAKNWYGLNASGRTLNMAAVCCPFCRRQPVAKLIRNHHPALITLKNLDEAIRNRGAWIYAWCSQCDHARAYLERVCARGAPESTPNWRCDVCKNKEIAVYAERTLSCPGCGVAYQKVGGCDHMICSRVECGIEWCWYCGEAEPGDYYREHRCGAFNLGLPTL